MSYPSSESGDVARRWWPMRAATRSACWCWARATHGLQMQRLVATVPMRVVMDARCTLLVKQLPFRPPKLAEA